MSTAISSSSPAAPGPGAPEPGAPTAPGRRGGDPDGRAGAVPVRADGVELLGEQPGSGYRQAPGLVRRADGQTVQLTRLLYLVLATVDGRRDLAGIAEVVGARTGRLVSADDVRLLIDAKLRPLGLLRSADGGEPRVRPVNPLLALRLRYVVTDPAVTRRITAPFAALFHAPVLVPVVAAFAAVSGWLLFAKGLAAATWQAFDKPGLLLLVVAVSILSAGFHEFGHAAACRYGGASPGSMGAGIYVVWPAFYTDVSDSYRLGRAGRLRVDLGGLYFNAVFAVVAFAVWAMTGRDAILLIIAAQLLQMVRQLAPYVRADGYHILADLTGVPDLYSRIGPTLRGLLPHGWGGPESKALKPWARVVVTLWVLAVVPLLVTTSALMVLSLPRVAATAWASLARQWRALGVNLDHGDVAAVGLRLLSIVAIVLPLLGMALMVVRMARRGSVRAWRATAGRPVRRAGAIALAAAVVAAVAWAWWPTQDRYRPIGPHERGTVFDALPAGHRTTVGLRDGQVVRARTSVWAATTPPPTRQHPRLALVLVPRAAAGTAGASGTGVTPPAWVFPFNPPAPPGAGDNQALAVNTADGATRYDIAFALVWVTDGTALNRNEAYALASCRGCRTVAVAFQVVLVVGQANIVIPENISAAVNYSCVECVTYALAQQLVLTIPHALSADAMAKLTALWQQIETFAANIDHVPLAQLRTDLLKYESAILAVVRADLGVGAPGGTATPAGPGGSAVPTAGPSGEPVGGQVGASPGPGATTPTPTPTPASGPASASTPGPTSGPSTSSAPTATASPSDPAATTDGSVATASGSAAG